MRTTIDLPDSLMKAAQEKAAVTGESLADLFERAIAREVGWPAVAGGEVEYPLIRSRRVFRLGARELDETLTADETESYRI